MAHLKFKLDLLSVDLLLQSADILFHLTLEVLSLLCRQAAPLVDSLNLLLNFQVLFLQDIGLGAEGVDVVNESIDLLLCFNERCHNLVV